MRAHVRTYPSWWISAYLAAKQPRHEVRVSTWLSEILTRAMLAEAHCMQHQKYKLIAKTNVIFYIPIRLTQLYYELCAL